MVRPCRSIAAAATLMAGFALVSASYGLAPKSSKKAPPKKPAASTKKPVVLGSQAFSGENGAQIGTTYTLGKENPLNVTLDSVEYSVGRIAIGEHRNTPRANEKFIVITFTVQNPQRGETQLRYDTIHWFVVDAKDVNHENVGWLGVPGTSDVYDANLKPTQKKTVFAYIVVPADLVVPKLVAKSSDEKVLRYDLHGKIKPLTGPAADPKDTTGATALAEVPMRIGTTFQLGGPETPPCDFTLENVAFLDDTKIGEREVGEGKRFLVLTASFVNQGNGKNTFRYDSFQPKVTTTDGESIDHDGVMLHPSAGRDIEYNVEQGKGGRFRMTFQFPKDSKPDKLYLRMQETDRAYVFDISNLK